MWRGKLKPNNRKDECGQKKYAPWCYRLFEKKNSQNHRTHGTYAGPHGVSCAGWNGVGTPHRFEKQKHAQTHRSNKRKQPQPELFPWCLLHFSKAECEQWFEHTSNNQNNPVDTHFSICFTAARFHPLPARKDREKWGKPKSIPRIRSSLLLLTNNGITIIKLIFLGCIVWICTFTHVILLPLRYLFFFQVPLAYTGVNTGK